MRRVGHLLAFAVLAGSCPAIAQADFDPAVGAAVGNPAPPRSCEEAAGERPDSGPAHAVQCAIAATRGLIRPMRV